ncbi:hypothetical protein IEU95_03835 [Hoyosella rhizosphaerae]|uniref:Bacteriocin biosynthesis cyclodehydratase domain-containing protein n=1 Tax=Hoyosella rhizosphaerae TaxID=1755582 RepID=A0A916UBB8_9ACTN|nr:hypothetical protein [Hoyosella rhizosphaerae]MBN4925944.1 hypothetical protein [Hoyosella rhizosphaerae]GGC66758.1 hypothetical protein GCM10011410_19220 [Hoyosella rhizosphaerae]
MLTSRATTNQVYTESTPVGKQTYPLLDPALPVLVRPSSQIQVGWDPDSALILDFETSIPTEALANVLRKLDGHVDVDTVVERSQRIGLAPDVIRHLLGVLYERGIVTDARPHNESAAAPSICVIGRGPLTDAIAAAVPRLGAKAHRYTTPEHMRTQNHALDTGSDLTILADLALFPPRITDALIQRRIAHLVVRTRDNRGLVGPLVVPGVTSCLRCADHFRTDNDPEWPYLASQLTSSIPTATPTLVHATVGYALGQIELVLAARRAAGGIGPSSPPPETLGATVEISAPDYSITTRHWPRHPQCHCWNIVPPVTSVDDT